MNTAKLSSKFQLSIPKAIRDHQNLQAGQLFTIVERGHIIELVPTRNLKDARGMLQSSSYKETSEYRDRAERKF